MSFMPLSASLSYFLPPPFFPLSNPVLLCFCALILSSSTLPSSFTSIFVYNSFSVSYLAARMHTYVLVHTRAHPHLSVISMRWFLMRLGPTGSSHSNLHQHPLPWLLVCLCVCMCGWVYCEKYPLSVLEIISDFSPLNSAFSWSLFLVFGLRCVSLSLVTLWF